MFLSPNLSSRIHVVMSIFQTFWIETKCSCLLGIAIRYRPLLGMMFRCLKHMMGRLYTCSFPLNDSWYRYIAICTTKTIWQLKKLPSRTNFIYKLISGVLCLNGRVLIWLPYKTLYDFNLHRVNLLREPIASPVNLWGGLHPFVMSGARADEYS